MQRKFLNFLLTDIILTAQNIFKMIPAVVVSLLLVTSTIALPLTTQEHPTTGYNETPQIQSGNPLSTIPQTIEKTGVQTLEEGQRIREELNQGEKSTIQTDQFTELNIARPQQSEKTGFQTPSEEQTVQSQQNTAVPKVENVPVNVEQAQSTLYPQNPVLLPVQPLSVVPVHPTGQILRPVVVPAEAIADGRVIITPIGSVQQRNFQDFTTPEKHVTQQQVTHPTGYTSVQTQGVEPNQQTYYLQPVEKRTPLQQQIQPTGQVYNPVQIYPNQEQFNKEQQISSPNVQQNAEPVQNYYQAPVDHSFPQNVQPENPEKQATTGQLPVQSAEYNSQQQSVYTAKQGSEKQGQYQQNYYDQNQAYSGKPIVVENVEKQVPYQQPTESQTQYVEPGYQQQQVYNPQQAVEKQAEVQQGSGYTSAQNQHVVQGTEKQGQYQQGYTQPQEQNVEKQTVYQQSVQGADFVPTQTQNAHQQQVYSVQPEQVENHVPYNHASQQQNLENVQEQIVRTSEVEPNQQVVGVQPQQVANYAGEPFYNFGDKLPQVQHHVPVQTLSGVPQTQINSVQPPVSSTPE